VSDVQHRSAPNPYSAGGGGVVLEHVYGATLLAALLLGAPLDLMGDELAIDEVAFQAWGTSTVDDYVVTGSTEGPDIVQRRLAIAVRRDPTMAPSDGKFVKLVGAMLTVLDRRWSEIVTGTWRLGLVVAGPHTGASETATLTELARAHPTPDRFRVAVDARGTTTGRVRQRLGHLERVMKEVLNVLPHEDTAEVLTWRLLFGLRVAAVQLEGDVAPDRTAWVDRLRPLATGTTDASSLFGQLTELAGHYAPIAAEVGETSLRRDLIGRAQVRASLRHGRAWEALTRLGARARSRTGTALVSGGTMLEVDRSTLKGELREAILTGGAETGMIVTGDPDVGKSALTIAVVEELASEGAAVHVLNLRDVPQATLEFEHHLGGALVDVLGSGPVADIRALVIDGAEAVLEGWGEVFSDVVEAAKTAGVPVVAVTRRDASAVVSRTLSGDGEIVEPFTVPALTVEERAEVVITFPSLSRFTDDVRASWLLGRPGLVDLVLRADVATSLPGGALCEGQVLIAVWGRLVRRDELHRPGEPGPDAREQALLALATRAITGERAAVTDPSALPSLRSDGILLPAGPDSAWAGTEQFAGDLIRDFALAWQFLVNGFGVLTIASAPRWAVRATLLAVQARLVNTDDVVTTRRELQAALDEVAMDHGQRWSDLVDEATLTLGSSEVLDRVWPTLVTNNASGLQRSLRVVTQRHTVAGVAEPLVAGPLADVYLAHAGSAELPAEVWKSAEEVVIAYLRGLVLQGEDRPDPIRLTVRERALGDANVERHVEALGLLGVDLDDRTDAALRTVADERPHLLDDVVESPAAVVSMAKHRPDLLLCLAEAYYIEKPGPDHNPFDAFPYDDGVRHHTKMGVGFPFAAWWAGPFWALLRAHPIPTLAFLNRMFDHACGFRVQSDEGLFGAGSTGPLEADLPHFGRRALAGDSHTWSWYRGTGVGPYPCTSALLAVERAADAWHEMGGISLEVVVYRLLEACNNLAMLGLTVGFLVRHLEDVTTELDAFLVQPLIWEIEFGRMVGEHTGLRAQIEDPETHGHDKRKYSLADVGCTLTIRAMLAGDQERTAALEELADQLVAKATGEDGSVDPTVHIWASNLRASQFEATPLEDGRIALQVKAPSEAAAALASRQAEMALGNEGWRLLNSYARDERRPSDPSRLVEDVSVARQIAQSPPTALGRIAIDAAVAVAATALVAHGDGRVSLSLEDVEWAANGVVGAVIPPSEGGLDFSGSFHTTGADRSSAAALPSLLLPSFNENSQDGGFHRDDLEVVKAALHDCATSNSDEVRRALGAAMAGVWEAPCHELLEGQCRHEIALDAVDVGLRDCRLGPRFNYGRDPLPITGDLTSVLGTVEGEDLLLERLTGPVVALAAAAVGSCCIADRATALLDGALTAQRRALVEQSASQYSLRDEGQVPVVRALVDLCARGRKSCIVEHALLLMDDPAALWLFLRLLAQVATYDQERRAVVFEIWPELAHAVIGELARDRILGRAKPSKGAYRRSDAMAALVLRPQLMISDSDADETLTEADAHWIPLKRMRSTIEEWLPLVTGSVEALDNLLCYLGTLPCDEQIDPGLTWVAEIVSGDYGRFAGRTFRAPRWLTEIRGHVHEDDATRLFRSVVDGFANAGDYRFVAIQKVEEESA
jgi:hypothetical protein